MEAKYSTGRAGMRTLAGLPSVLRALLATGQVLDPPWASGCAACAGPESRSGLMALSLGQQHVPCVERPAVAGEPVLWGTGCRSLVYSGQGPWARARSPGQAAASQARGGVGDPALGEVVLTAAGVLAAPRGGAGNWGPPLGHPVAVSCEEGPTVSCSWQGTPHGVESHLGRGVGKAVSTHRKLGVSSSLLPPGWLGKTSSRK